MYIGMNKTPARILIACSLLFINSNTVAAEPSAAELRGICEAEREKPIATLRQQAIEECANKHRGKTREECERFYKDYGEASRTQQRGFIQRMFNDIPECIAADEAEKSENAGKNRDTEPGKKRDTEPGKQR